jgi:hypothetical protein
MSTAFAAIVASGSAAIGGKPGHGGFAQVMAVAVAVVALFVSMMAAPTAAVMSMHIVSFRTSIS